MSEEQKTLEIKKELEKDELCEELKRYNSIEHPSNILFEIALSRKHNLLLQIRDNNFLFFAITRISINKENQQLIFHSVYLSEVQVRLLYEKIPEILSEFRKIKSQRGNHD
jgi:hypothetical protein